MSAKIVTKIVEFDTDVSALSAGPDALVAGPDSLTVVSNNALQKEFGECWAAIHEDNDNVDEHALRRMIESATDHYLETSVCEYLRDLVLHNPFHFFLKGLAVKLPPSIERFWKHYDKSTVDDATELRKCVLSLIKPFIDCAPPRMKLRARIDFWKKPKPIPAHNTAPAFGIAIDAITGEIHRRFYGTNTANTDSPLIACGVTLLIQPFRHGDEAWTQDQGQGGYMFSEDQTMLTNDRAMRLEGPKP